MTKRPERVPTPRPAWVTPTVRKIAAGEAEVGPNPVGGDGNFTRS